MSNMNWFRLMGRKLRPEAILDVTKGGDTANKEWRRLGNLATGAVSGAITGGKTGGVAGAIIGAAGGGIHGYQSKKPATLKNLGTKAVEGAAIGYGGGSLANLAGSGGTGWSLGIGKGANGESVKTAASSPATKTNWMRFLNMGGGNSPQGSAGTQAQRELSPAEQWLKKYREKYYYVGGE